MTLEFNLGVLRELVCLRNFTATGILILFLLSVTSTLPSPSLSPLTEDVENIIKELRMEIALDIILPPLHATMSKLTQRVANVAETREVAVVDISRIRRGINTHKIQS